MSDKKEILPFGKYEGWNIRKVPVEYLWWLLKNKTQYAWMAQSELNRRSDEFNKKR
jgi:uncharacterized protein (DUF3820 family)